MFTYYSLVKQVVYGFLILLSGNRFLHLVPDTFCMVGVAKRAPGLELKSSGPRVWGSPFIRSPLEQQHRMSLGWASLLGKVKLAHIGVGRELGGGVELRPGDSHRKEPQDQPLRKIYAA